MDSESNVKFSQRHRTVRREVVLVEDGIKVMVRALGEKTKFTVPYETVLRDPVEFTGDRTRTPIFAGIAFALGLVALSLMVGAILLTLADRLLQKLPKTQLFQVSDSQPALVVNADAPNRNEVVQFMQELKGQSDKYLVETYGTAANRDSKVGQIERLAQLQEQGAISEDEYANLKAELVCATPVDDTGHGQYL
jgi:hypothetical protein